MVTATGPFIVRVVRHTFGCRTAGSTAVCTCEPEILYREAFATLEEARVSAAAAVLVTVGGRRRDASHELLACEEECHALGPRGGSITLPNGGGMVKVETAVRLELAGGLSNEQLAELIADPDWPDNDLVLLCAAWNAEHGIGIGAAR